MAAVVVSVLVATVGILYLEGIPPIGHPPGTHHPTGPVTFRVARQQAEGAVSGYHGGGWSLIAGGALMTQATIGLPNASLGSQLSNLVPGCPLSWLGGSQTEVIPSFSGNSSTGLSPFWGLVFRNASEGLLLVSVINGSAILSAHVAGTANCNLSLGIALIGALPSDLPDSDVIASAAGSAGGFPFLKAHPGADASMVLVGGLSLFTF
ncbi:MAG TPA: hypothetical protein VGV64_08320, partial [Thermoplasmata archaeon]|nr:hypothetical protein [Thermoplasmata archaeon]